jgi:hypothetical protein
MRLIFFPILLCAGAIWAGSPEKHEAKEKTQGEETGLSAIPLVVGHEAKGLVLPDFDLQGHLRGRFEAVTARRIDQEHVEFDNLKMVTYVENEKPDLELNMSTGVLNLETHVLDSKARSKIKRADFEIEGDSMRFNTETREGTLIGNVKMTITDQSHFARDKE